MPFLGRRRRDRPRDAYLHALEVLPSGHVLHLSSCWCRAGAPKRKRRK